jgi:hypothetical protein
LWVGEPKQGSSGQGELKQAYAGRQTLENQGFSQILFFKVLNFKGSTSDDKMLRDF